MGDHQNGQGIRRISSLSQFINLGVNLNFMALQLHYVCIEHYRNTPIKTLLTATDCPNNYPSNHRRPQLNDIFQFDRRINYELAQKTL